MKCKNCGIELDLNIETDLCLSCKEKKENKENGKSNL